MNGISRHPLEEQRSEKPRNHKRARRLEPRAALPVLVELAAEPVLVPLPAVEVLTRVVVSTSVAVSPVLLVVAALDPVVTESKPVPEPDAEADPEKLGGATTAERSSSAPTPQGMAAPPGWVLFAGWWCSRRQRRASSEWSRSCWENRARIERKREGGASGGKGEGERRTSHGTIWKLSPDMSWMAIPAHLPETSPVHSILHDSPSLNTSLPLGPVGHVRYSGTGQSQGNKSSRGGRQHVGRGCVEKTNRKAKMERVTGCKERCDGGRWRKEVKDGKMSGSGGKGQGAPTRGGRARRLGVCGEDDTDDLATNTQELLGVHSRRKMWFLR
ncbi:hypothetical protein BDZ89DRAFT_1213347 [Hymenopellis radicata]|nr:hypothetical protein BDZ89DRAFT_1213347 [Hymenopellis radicata]